MSEAHLPLPDPEPGSYWDPEPARCSECGVIIDAHPASREDGRWMGWCPKHGEVLATYHSYRIEESRGEE